MFIYLMPFIIPVIAGIAEIAVGVGTFVSGLGVIGTAVVGAGLSVALGYIQQALTGKPKNPDTSSNLPGGVNFERQYGENVSRQVACGLIAIAGHDVYVNTYSTSNNLLQQVYVLSDYYSTRLTRVAIGGVWQTLGMVADPVKGFPIVSGQFANLIWIKFLNGRQTVADAGLVSHANPASRWTNANIGVGVTAVIVSMTYDKDKNNSYPDFFFEFEGAPLYDWRKDSSVGGSGTHRLNDYTTHEYSANPILMEYNYRYGFRVNDDLFCGMDMPISDLPLDKFTVAANICDETVDGENRYVCSIFLDCMTTHGDNLQSIATSCGAIQIDGVDGSWPIVGSDQPTVATITDGDFIVGTDKKFRKLRSMGDLVNSVSGNFPDPSQFWSMVGYDQQTSSDLVTLDRRTRDVSIDFPMVPSLRQSDQLAWIYLYENRFEATLNGTLRPRFQVLEAGDWVLYNSARYGTLTFIVVSTSLASLDADGPRNAVLSFQQRDGKIYDGITPIPIVVPTPPGLPVYASEVDSFSAIAVAVTGDDGRAQAAIRAAWATILDTTITAVEVRYYPTEHPESAITKTVTADVSVVTLVEGVVGATEYTVQTKIITNPSRTTVYAAGETVTTLDIGSDADAIIAIISAQMAGLTGPLRDQLETMNTQINQLRMNQAASPYVDRRVLRQDLVSITGDAFAQISDVREVSTTTQNALASFTTTVTAQFGEQGAAITTNETAIADISGYASANYTLKLNVNNAVTGMQLFNGGPGISGVIFTTDSFLIQTPSGAIGSEVPMFTVGIVNGVAGQAGLNGNFVVKGSITAESLAVIKLDAISADMGDITAGTLSSPDGKYFLDLVNTRELISD